MNPNHDFSRSLFFFDFYGKMEGDSHVLSWLQIPSDPILFHTNNDETIDDEDEDTLHPT